MAISSAITHAPIAILDEEGDIVEVNQAWEAFGDRNGLPERYTALRKDYIAIAERADDKYGDRVAAELRSLLASEQMDFRVIYPCHSPNQERWFCLYATAVTIEEDQYYLLVHQRLHGTRQSEGDWSSDVADHLPTSDEYQGGSRLVTYNLSVEESATHGIITAFDAIGIDPQGQDTTLQDWIHIDAINNLQASTPELHTTFIVWHYPVTLTPDAVIIYTPRNSSD